MFTFSTPLWLRPLVSTSCIDKHECGIIAKKRRVSLETACFLRHFTFLRLIHCYKGKNSPKMLTYKIEDAPPIHLCVLLGIQQFLTMIGGTIAMPLIISEATCVGEDFVGRTEILGVLMFVSGLSTLFQTIFGVRLPILQGASFAFIAPMMAMQNLEEFKCPTFTTDPTMANNGTVLTGSDEHRQVWKWRLVQIQGALMIAGSFEALLGMVGFVGILLKAIGPLTIAPTIGLVGLSFTDDIVSNYAAKYWPIALLSLVLVITFTLYINEIGVPLPMISIMNKKLQCGVQFVKIFGMFPVLFSMILTWIVCVICTLAGAFSNEPTSYSYQARTDTRLEEFSSAPWFRFPYPGQWGLPQVHIGLTIGMTAAIMSSIVESIGDYCACARMCEIPTPPPHAINRGIMAEGLGCLIAGAFGCGPGVTSYSENIGAIAITRVGSRRVFFYTAVLLLFLGCLTKFAAVFVLIPDPVLGGILIAMLSMVSAVGFSNLQFVDLNITRNLLVFGLSMFLGIAMPMWVKGSGREMIKTGSQLIDQVLIILLSTGMLVGGLVGFCLDNTVPGATRRQRGFIDNDKGSDTNDNENATSYSSYDLPFITPWLHKQRWARFIPILPPFKPLCNASSSDDDKKNDKDIMKKAPIATIEDMSNI